MNYHQSLMNIIIHFFCLFASALALFLASLFAKDVFLFLFPKRSGFYLIILLSYLNYSSFTHSSGFAAFSQRV